MTEEKKPKKIKKKTKKDSNVVNLFNGELIPMTAPIDTEKAIKTILKEGGFKKKRFILITYGDDSDPDVMPNYYTSGDTMGAVNFHVDQFKLFLMGVIQ